MIYWRWNSTGMIFKKYFFLLISLYTGNPQTPVNIEELFGYFYSEYFDGAL